MAITLSSQHGQSPPPVTFEGPASLLPGKAALDYLILVSPAGLSGSLSGGSGAHQLTVVDPANATYHAVQPFSRNTLLTFPWSASGDEVVAVNGLQFTDNIPQVGTAVAFSRNAPEVDPDAGRPGFLTQSTPIRPEAISRLSTPPSAIRPPPKLVARSRRSPLPDESLSERVHICAVGPSTVRRRRGFS